MTLIDPKKIFTDACGPGAEIPATPVKVEARTAPGVEGTEPGRDAFTAEPGRSALKPRPDSGLNPLLVPSTGGALDCRPPAQPVPAWKGPMTSLAQFSDKAEDAILASLNTQLAVLPLDDFDPTKRPVLLVHGYQEGPNRFPEVAKRLKEEGHQVLVVYYDDNGRAVHENGEHLARELVRLQREYYSHDTELTIVGHSMGGLVTRTALNSLEDPDWLHEDRDGPSVPRAGFKSVQAFSLDTPWEGFAHTIPDMLVGFFQFLIRIFGFPGVVDMLAKSDMYARIFNPELDGVDLKVSFADNPGEPDVLRSLPDLRPEELDILARFVLYDELPEPVLMRNFAGTLAQDSRFQLLQEELREALADNAFDTEDPGEALVMAYEEVMPLFVGTHGGILQEDPDPEAYLVDWLSEEVGAAAATDPRTAARFNR